MLQYDPEDRLKSYGTSTTTALTMGYRSDGLRAWKQTSTGVRTYFLYDGATLLHEMNASGTVTATDTWGADGLVSRYTSTAPSFYAYTPSGNVADVTGLGSTTPTAQEYDAYGVAVAGGGASPYGYGAQWGDYTDTQTGLVLCTYRYYDPANGRFINRDPIGQAGGINLYAYTGNNPVNFSDPSGLLAGNPIFIEVGAGAVGGAGEVAGGVALGPIAVGAAATAGLMYLGYKGGEWLGDYLFPMDDNPYYTGRDEPGGAGLFRWPHKWNPSAPDGGGGGGGGSSDRELDELRNMWDPGTYSSPAESAKDHAKRKGPQVGAYDELTYLRKAKNFNPKGALKKPVKDQITGEQIGWKYERDDGCYIEKDFDGKIITFGRN